MRPDERFSLDVGKTSSQAYLLINCSSSLTTEVRCLAATRPLEDFRVVLPRTQGVEYDLTHHGESFFIRINDGAAKTFRVIEAPVADPSKNHWKEIVAARPEATVESVLAFADHLVLEETASAAWSSSGSGVLIREKHIPSSSPSRPIAST